MTRFLVLISLMFYKCIFGSHSPQPKILSTTLMIYDSLRQIFPQGNHEFLMGPGTDPHLYKATSQDLLKIKNANLVIYGGFHLEGKMVEIFENLEKQSKALKVSDFFPSHLTLKDENLITDPHIWFEPLGWIEAFRKITDYLKNKFPQNSQNIESNFSVWSNKIQSTHQHWKTKFKDIPVSQRILITSHDAFQYFGRAFDIQVKAIQGISTQSEGGLKDLSDMIDLVKKHKIKAIFVESSVSKDSIEKVSKQTKVKIGGELFSDSMGPPGSDHGTYQGMLEYNLKTIYENLK